MGKTFFSPKSKRYAFVFHFNKIFFREIDSAESKNKMIEESNIKCFCTIFREIDKFPITKAHPIPNHFYVKMNLFFLTKENLVFKLRNGSLSLSLLNHNFHLGKSKSVILMRFD